MYLVFACKHICFPPGKRINRRNESTNSELFRIRKPFRILYYWFALCRTDDIKQYSFIVSFPLLKTVKLQIDFPFKKDTRFFISENTFPVEMATRDEMKLAASIKKTVRNILQTIWRKTQMFPEDYITQVSEKIEGRVTKKLPQEFSRTENRILGALARLDDFLMNPLIQGQCGDSPETSRNVFSISQGTNEDDSQSNIHPDAGIFNNQMTQNSGPEDGHDTSCKN